MIKQLPPDLTGPVAWCTRDWAVLGLLLTGAAALRLLLFNGFFGSDDLVYFERSVQIANGIWSNSDYIGALRYGYNIPAALSVRAFGVGAISATLWPLLCSLAELVTVYVFAAAFVGRRAAIYSTILLATTPLHIALPTRIHPDAVLACFLTLSFVLFYAAERGGQRLRYFVAGLAMGTVFWVKELALITLLTFLTYPFLARRWDGRWLWTIAGGGVMLVGHLMLMQAIAGHPFHTIETVLKGLGGNGLGSSDAAAVFNDSPGYYLHYLIGDIRHTFLLGYLSLAALLGLAFRRLSSAGTAGPIISCPIYIAWWLLALLAVLSILPISLAPLRFATKQPNYINLFLAPLALLGGIWLAQLSRVRLRIGLLGIAVLGGLGLGAMEQAAYRVFTANSRAAVELAAKHPNALFVGSVNNARLGNASLNRALTTPDGEPAGAARFMTLAERTAAERSGDQGHAAYSELLVLVDRETERWGMAHVIVVDRIPECWTKVEDLHPGALGVGADVVQALRRVVSLLGTTIASAIDRPLRQLVEPAPATVYRVNGDSLWCGGSAPPISGPLGQAPPGTR